jgi:hypothetical protein
VVACRVSTGLPLSVCYICNNSGNLLFIRSCHIPLAIRKQSHLRAIIILVFSFTTQYHIIHKSSCRVSFTRQKYFLWLPPENQRPVSAWGQGYVLFCILRDEPVIHFDFPLDVIFDKVGRKVVIWSAFFPLGS